MQPPDLESAVATIRHLKEQELADPGSAPDSGAADALAKFLLLHVDAEQVRASPLLVQHIPPTCRPSCPRHYPCAGCADWLRFPSLLCREHLHMMVALYRRTLAPGQPSGLQMHSASHRLFCSCTRHNSLQRPLPTLPHDTYCCRRHTVRRSAGTTCAPRTSSYRCPRRTPRNTSLSSRVSTPSPTPPCSATASTPSSGATRRPCGTRWTLGQRTMAAPCSMPATTACCATFWSSCGTSLHCGRRRSRPTLRCARQQRRTHPPDLAMWCIRSVLQSIRDCPRCRCLTSCVLAHTQLQRSRTSACAAVSTIRCA